MFRNWTVRQQALRDAKGSMRMASVEKKFVFDEKHEVKAIVDAPRYFSMTLIEETALAANQAVGDLFRARGLPTIYRVHPEKDPEEIEAVAKRLEEHGIRVPTKDRLTGRDIARLIQAARKKPNAEALIQRIMGLIERAVYEVHDHEDVATHFGLARKAYLHFTSPIRRYPDLIVHRWLASIETRGGEAETELKATELVADLNDVASHCSLQSELAEMAENSMADLKVCQFMEPHIGEKLAAQVVRVSPGGLEVQLLDLQRHGVPAGARDRRQGRGQRPDDRDQERQALVVVHRGPSDRGALEGRRFRAAASDARAGVSGPVCQCAQDIATRASLGRHRRPRLARIESERGGSCAQNPLTFVAVVYSHCVAK